MWELAGLVLLGGGVRLWLKVRQDRERLQVWQQAAASCGLQQVEVSRSALKACKGPLGVLIEEAAEKKSRSRIYVVVPGPRGFRDVVIRPESRIPLPQDIEVGDRSFDDALTLQGPQRLVFSLLDAEARRLLYCLNVESRLEISGGALQAVAPHLRVTYLLPLLLDVGQRFVQAMEDPRRVAENAKRDPVKDVRLRNLLLLVRELPGDPMTVEALHTACADPSPEIRLRAAMEMGAEGRSVLLDLAEGMQNDDCSAQAIRTLDRELPFERTKAILYAAQRRRLGQTARACLETLGSSGNAAAVALLTILVGVETGELAAAAASALGATGTPDAEQPLLKALGSDEVEVRLAAATALARVGSAAAVLPLKEAADRLPSTAEIRKATREAIAEIQSRLKGASPGQLSLSSHEAGQLSLAQAETGQLSLDTEQAGELSLMGPHLPDPPLPKGEEEEKPPGSAGIPAG